MKQLSINKKTLTRGGSSDGYGIKVPSVAIDQDSFQLLIDASGVTQASS